MKRKVGEMERSNLMQPGAGHPIGGGIVLKVGADDSNHMSVFEITVAPGHAPTTARPTSPRS